MTLRSHRRSPITSTRGSRRESLEGVQALQDAEDTAAALDAMQRTTNKSNKGRGRHPKPSKAMGGKAPRFSPRTLTARAEELVVQERVHTRGKHKVKRGAKGQKVERQ